MMASKKQEEGSGPGSTPGFAVAQEEAARDLRQGKLTFAMRVGRSLTGNQGAADQDEGMQGAWPGATSFFP